MGRRNRKTAFCSGWSGSGAAGFFGEHWIFAENEGLFHSCASRERSEILAMPILLAGYRRSVLSLWRRHAITAAIGYQSCKRSLGHRSGRRDLERFCGRVAVGVDPKLRALD